MGCAPTKGSRIGTVSYGFAAGGSSDSAGSKAPRDHQPSNGQLQAAAAGSHGGSSTTVDPKLGLTERELYKLKASWKAVHRHVADTGVEMFISLFRTNSDLKTMFMQFSNLELSDSIRENGDLAIHGQLVMGVLDDAILNIENMQPTMERVKKVAATHRKFAGFLGSLFWAMEQPFLEAVRITLEDRYNDTVADIYARTIHYILGEMEAGFNEVAAASGGGAANHATVG